MKHTAKKIYNSAWNCERKTQWGAGRGVWNQL